MTFNIISCFDSPYLEKIKFKTGTKTVLDKVIEYNGRSVIIHVDEFYSGEEGEKIRSVNVYYLRSLLYGSKNDSSVKMTKVDLIRDPWDQFALERIVADNLDIRGTISFED